MPDYTFTVTPTKDDTFEIEVAEAVTQSVEDGHGYEILRALVEDARSGEIADDNIRDVWSDLMSAVGMDV